MKVVIDIDDKIYKDIKNWKIHNFDYRIPLSCILEGIVLPKEHGDLIDRSKLHTNYISTTEDTDLEVYLTPVVDTANIVIPADK